MELPKCPIHGGTYMFCDKCREGETTPNIPLDRLKAVSETMVEELKRSQTNRRIQKKFPPHQQSTHTTIKHTTLDTIAADMLRLAERFTAKIVCLCGSGRFKQAYGDAEYRETLAGRIVLTIGCNTKDIARSDELKHHKPMLDELHLRKIDLADEVYVLDVNGYIGESTRKEIEYAEKLGKPIRYLSKTPASAGGGKDE